MAVSLRLKPFSAVLVPTNLRFQTDGLIIQILHMNYRRAGKFDLANIEPLQVRESEVSNINKLISWIWSTIFKGFETGVR